MIKKPPQLKLVNDIAQREGKSSAPYAVVSLAELPPVDQERVKRILSTFVPGAALLGVQRTPRPWDLRPVLVSPEDNGPSIIRFVGPDVMLSLNIGARMEELMVRLGKSREIASRLLDWGKFEGQLWYRREMVEETLEDNLRRPAKYSLTDILEIAKRIVLTLQRWHEQGIAHGHLTCSNIALNELRNVSFLDSGLGLAIVQSSKGIGENNFIAGYSKKSFAPESFEGESVILSSDIYGLGIVLSQLLTGVEEKYRLSHLGAEATGQQRTPHLLRALKDVAAAMSEPEIQRRPSLSEALRLINEALPTYRASTEHRKSPNVNVAKPTHGKTITTRGKIPGAPIQHTQPHIKEKPTKESPAKDKARLSGENTETHTNQNTELGRSRDLEKTTPNSVEENKQILQEPVNRVHKQVKKEEILKSLEREFGTKEPLRPLNKEALEDSLYLEEDQRLQIEPVKVESEKVNNFSFTLFFAVGFVLLAGYIYYRGISESGVRKGVDVAHVTNLPELRSDEIETAWLSGAPSHMSRVVSLALNSNHPLQFAAESVILRSVRDGSILSPTEIKILRTAFFPAWERELRTDDRRTALALALGRYVGEMPADLPHFSSLHPGVILAMIASSGPEVGKFFENVPAMTLAKLPQPFGAAFRVLAVSKDGISCGDESVRTLALLATTSLSQSEAELVKFLRQDPIVHLLALAHLFAEDNESSRVVLFTAISHPNARIESENINWARRFNVLSWSAVEESEKLMLVAGIPPRSKLTEKQVAELLAHPLANIRSKAIQMAIESIPFSHPGAFDVLDTVQAKPGMLNAEQTLQLALLLASSGEIPGEKIAVWFATNPAIELVEKLLLATSTAAKASQLDFECARYLKDNGWKGSPDTLRKLSKHPDKFTRLFVYSQIYGMENRQLALALLQDARSSEPERVYQLRLDDMIRLINRDLKNS